MNPFEKTREIIHAAQCGRIDINQAVQAVRDYHAEAEYLANPSPGPCVRFYLARLSVDELSNLLTVASHLEDRSRSLAEWLRGVVLAEGDRRDSEAPVESQFPSVAEWLSWTDAELVEANVALVGITRSVAGYEQGNFLDHCLATLAAVLLNRFGG